MDDATELLFRKQDIYIVNDIISKKITRFIIAGDTAFIDQVRIDFEIDPHCKSIVYVTLEQNASRLLEFSRGAAICYYYGLGPKWMRDFMKYLQIQEITNLKYAKNLLHLMEAIRQDYQPRGVSNL